jgi:hypothetical protein
MANTNNTNNANGNAIVFNVTFGDYIVDGYKTNAYLPANAAVLMRNCRRKVNGEYIDVVEFMAVTGVRRTKADSVMLPLLALMVADGKVRNGFASEFATVKVNGVVIDTKLTAKSTFTRWLSGNTVYKTDADGVLKNELTVDDGLLLKHTALNVRKTSPMLTAEGDELTALLKTTAKAIAKQATLRSLILKSAKNIFDATEGNVTSDEEGVQE